MHKGPLEILHNGVWTPIKSPTSISYTLSDVDAPTTGRDQLGNMHRDRVNRKHKLSCSWSSFNMDEMSELLNLVSAPSFKLKYPDAETGRIVQGIFYVGDRTTPVLVWSHKYNEYRWKSLSMNFTEM